MPRFRFNNPLILINKKPKGDHMTANGYGFYMYPSLVLEYACKTLKPTELRLYLAISGQAERDSSGGQCRWSIKHYCNIANIKSNHYAEVLQGLCEKGFIVHKDFESIEVLYPISKNEYLAPNGQITKMGIEIQENKIFPKWKSAAKQEKYSQIGINASNSKEKTSSQNKEELKTKKGNSDSNFSKNDSQSKANNKEINNNLINNNNKDKEGSKTSHKWEVLGNEDKSREDISIYDLL